MCGDSLDGIFCQRCTCESCGNDAHIGYNCPSKVPSITNPEPCYNQNVDEFPQTLPSFHPTCYSGDENSFTYDSNLNFVDDSPNPPPQPPTDSYEFCGNNAYYGHDWPPQEELSEYINTPSWNHPAFYNYDDDDDDDEDYTIAITPVLSADEPVDSLIMEDEHLDTISATESDEVIKSSVEDLVSILNQFEDFSDSNDDSTSIDDDYFSIDDIDYVEASPPDSEPISLEEVKDEILREKLLKIHFLIAKIESLNDNPTPDRVLKSPSLFPIPVEDSDSFFEKLNTSLSYSDNSLPEFEILAIIRKRRVGELTNVVMEDILGEPRVHVPNVLPNHPTLYLDSNFIPLDDSLGSDLEVSFPSGFRNKIFDLGIFFEVQSKIYLSRGYILYLIYS
nr:hypothetical protein [Tanacetum cinerariifolium]